MVVEVLELAVGGRELERVGAEVKAALLESHKRGRRKEPLAGLF